MKTFFSFVGLVGLIILSGLIVSLPVWILWNFCLVGAISGINEISWLQSWGILVLCNLFFRTTITKK